MPDAHSDSNSGSELTPTFFVGGWSSVFADRFLLMWQSLLSSFSVTLMPSVCVLAPGVFLVFAAGFLDTNLLPSSVCPSSAVSSGMSSSVFVDAFPDVRLDLFVAFYWSRNELAVAIFIRMHVQVKYIQTRTSNFGKPRSWILTSLLVTYKIRF